MNWHKSVVGEEKERAEMENLKLFERQQGLQLI